MGIWGFDSANGFSKSWSRVLSASIIICQVLATVSFFNPWIRNDVWDPGAPLVWAYDILIDDLRLRLVPIVASIIICFAASLASAALLGFSSFSDHKRNRNVRRALLLNSIAAAGPSIFISAWMLIKGDDPDHYVYVVLHFTEPWWYVAVISAVTAWLLMVYVSHRDFASAGASATRASDSPSVSRWWMFTSFALATTAVGVALAIYGYTQTWATYSCSQFMAISVWSTDGIGAAASLCLIPVAGLAAILALCMSVTSISDKSHTLLLASQAALVTALVMSLSWGIAVNQYEYVWLHPTSSISIVTDLHDGWFISIFGQAIAIAGTVLRPSLLRMTRA